MLSMFLIVFFLLIGATMLPAAEPKIEVFAAAPYDRHIIYQALVLFWIGIIGLVVIIAMKLREIKRIQDMGIDEEEKDAPFLD
mgnify:FL=1|jgi:hypothetical protein